MSESLFEKQRDILFEACKKIATDKRCPEWISNLLRDEVMKAKQLKEDFPSFDDDKPIDNTPLKEGDVVIVNSNNTSCKAKLLNKAISPDPNVDLWDVQVVENNKTHVIGTIFHNIPNTMIRKE